MDLVCGGALREPVPRPSRRQSGRLLRRMRSGVSPSGIYSSTSAGTRRPTPDTGFYVSKALYEANIKSDGDKDGVFCEA